jgi:hypothetical protein
MARHTSPGLMPAWLGEHIRKMKRTLQGRQPDSSKALSTVNDSNQRDLMDRARKEILAYTCIGIPLAVAGFFALMAQAGS